MMEVSNQAVVKHPFGIAHQKAVELTNILRVDSPSPDASITVGSVGSRVFLVHRVILDGQSPVFERMFKTQMVEGQTGIVTINDAAADDFDEFLQYLYSGMPPENLGDRAKALYVLADKYVVKPLVLLCKDYFENVELKFKTAFELFVIAELYPSDLLETKIRVLEYLASNPQFVTNDEWEKFREAFPDKALQLMTLVFPKKCGV